MRHRSILLACDLWFVAFHTSGSCRACVRQTICFVESLLKSE